MRDELANTLVRLIDALRVISTPGIVITGAEVDFPLEVTSLVRQGSLVFLGSAPHSRWKSGVLPEVHLAKLKLELVESVEA